MLARVSDELLATCDREPIHIPGAIQPHGALLVVDEKSWNILRASANVQEFLGLAANSLLQSRLIDLFQTPSEVTAAVEAVRQAKPYSTHDRSIIEMGGPFSRFVCECHWLDEQTLVLEMEHPTEVRDAASFRGANLRCLRRITSVSEGGEGLCVMLPAVARSIRELTGYDRVMVYELDRDGHGTIVAEEKKDQLESFHGLHFPASDIPSQARKLYLLNRVRVLSNIAYAKVEIVNKADDDNATPFDMSLCHLRSMSPVHVEYLQNMGVAATLVISIVIEGQLWGLIACHHYRPKSIDAHLRNQCEKLAHVISLAIQADQQREIRRAIESSQSLMLELESKISQNDNWFQDFLGNAKHLLELMNAVGVVIFEENEHQSIGTVPYSGITEKIRRVLSHKGAGDIVDVDGLATLDAALESLGADFCGCLMTTISRYPEVQILWFRKEHRRTIEWAGNPDKVWREDQGSFRLSPRKSFEKWCQEIKGRSEPWSLQDRYIARAIAQFIGSRKVEDSSRQKFHFLANLSHEIRTPMAAIMGYVDELANDDHDAFRTPQHQEALATIQRNGVHLLKLLSDLLDLARLDAGTLILDMSDCSPRSIVRNVYAASHSAAQKKGLTLSIHASTPLPCRIWCDAGRLKQILLNLVDNAIKFTTEGSVRIEVRFNASRPQSIEFSIQDTGRGLSPADIQKLFKPFIQVDSSLTRQYGGTGLGLRIAKRLAQMHGGDVRLRDTTPGIGAEFLVRIATGLERVEDVEDLQDCGTTAVSDSSLASDISLPLNDLRVLVAEDGLDNQRLVAMLLRKAGANVTLVENGELAVEEVSRRFRSSEAVQVVLMDMQMPVMDGYTATRRLRNLGFTLPVVAITAHAVTGDRRKCLDAGCDDYLTKPVDRESLLRTIRRLTAEQRMLTACALME